MKPQVVVQWVMDTTVLEEISHRTPTVQRHQLEDLLKAAIVLVTPTGAGGIHGAASQGDAGGGGSDGGSSSHGAGRRASGGGDLGGRGHADSHVTGVSHGGYDARRRIEVIRRKKSSMAGKNDGFAAFSARLRNLLLPKKFKPLGITKYDAKQDLVQWLRCYALSIENTNGNNDTKCLYLPFCLDQAPLTWLKSLDKNSIDKWDQLKD
jgi:hypothetical protein